MGDVIDVLPYDGKIVKNGETVVIEFALKSDVLLDEVRAGGRINLIIGARSPPRRARGPWACRIDRVPSAWKAPVESKAGFTLAQKMVGRAPAACRRPGHPSRHLLRERKMTTVGSQDTTGPMTRDEPEGSGLLGFSADLVMQSFCHTAAYPKPVDVKTHRELPVHQQPRRRPCARATA